jgi:succinoglycan biosynthesis protein ExoV
VINLSTNALLLNTLVFLRVKRLKLYYYKSALGNFGDDLNGWLWNELLPDFFDDNDDVLFSGIGTIINTEMPKGKQWVVFSSGLGYGVPPSGFGGNDWNIISVRGPLSATLLGLPKEKYITDGAALLNTISEFKPVTESERAGTIFIPHHNALGKGQWEKSCDIAGIEFVSPRGEAKKIIHKIRHSKLVLADAMHAAIIADAMRVPWVPMVTSSQINTFKWLDWTQTISCPYTPIVLGGNLLKKMLHKQKVNLYGDKIFNSGEDVAEALKLFRNLRALNYTSTNVRFINKFKSVIYRIPNKFFRIFEDNFDKKQNNDDIIRIADSFREAEKKGGFLSSDLIFDENISRLQKALEKIKALK